MASLESPAKRFGDLYKAVQMQPIFSDSKTFADGIPRFPDAEILENYQQEKTNQGFDLKAFVEAHFDLPEVLEPTFKADTALPIESHIGNLWPVITRPSDEEDSGSLLPLPHPYIVPGGRFTGIYYWDSYFVMLGLRASGKWEMMENMVNNLAYLIDTYGLIPNGNRTYFLSRSQPPFLALMVELLAKGHPDRMFPYEKALRAEYDFWMAGIPATADTPDLGRRMVQLPAGALLNRYWDDHPTPRPESYREDVTVAAASTRHSTTLYRDLRAACESGWDFSSRWLDESHALASIHTTQIIPIDLNCLLYKLETTLATIYALQGATSIAQSFSQKAAARKSAILQYGWHEEKGFFMDYHFVTGNQTPVRSLAGLFPLFVGIATDAQAARVATVLERDFLKPGGLLTTLNTTTEQWDAPNGWAPLHWISVQGLRRYGHHELAHVITARWVGLNTRVYRNTGKLVEKYNVVDMSLEAGGGEYPVQDGFGWTNGVLLGLMREVLEKEGVENDMMI